MNRLTINQTLHGYDQGHSLLESSLLVSSDAKRNLMLMSDMSGSSMHSGFEEYITGYPIKEMGLYALAKTWNASEMKRPGCVWTHTLLIDFSDLFKLVDYSNVLKLFKRPDIDKDFKEYSNKQYLDLDIKPESSATILNNQVNPNYIKEIIYQLYKSNKTSILIQSDNSKLLEDLVLSIWLQQWPRLRRNFSFCTGAINARLLNNRILDLQVVPNKIDRSLMNKDNIIILNSDTDTNNTYDNWVNLLYEDLIYKSSDIRNYLKHFGADVNEDRSIIISLVELYYYFTNKNQCKLANTIEILSKFFPLKTDGVTLKKTVLNNINYNLNFDFPSYEEEKVLFELAVTEFYFSFDYSSLDFTERFMKLFDKDHKFVFEILNNMITYNFNPCGENVFEIISKSIDEKDIHLLNKNYRKLLLIFLNLNPSISYCKTFWQTNAIDQKENLYLLSKLENINWRDIISIALELNINIDRDVINNNKINIVSFILDWFNNSSNDKLSYFWLDLLKNNSQEVIFWLKSSSKININVIKIMPVILNPNSLVIRDCDIDVWLRIVPNDNIFSNYEEEISFKAFFLALAFTKSEDDNIELLAYSFEPVYKAELKSQLSFNSWQILEVHTIPLSIWKDWDKCKKLRNKLIAIFNKHNWPVKYLNKIVNDKEILNHLISKYNKIKG